ncbi:hypothetical protein [Kitasatospora kifunensis]|uniref:Uncharacterized protein n=1 Tax=Kitasatospora kifunensis TaxID=58351 RepID=A0A7W7VTV3_KITKI|nr:hypothetical protein [Kitasatospora kifunensis]MBB4922168.1 hypothetical protein [Kitasatospora kifunensis]
MTATEWVLTPQNLGELWNLIGHAKQHQSYPEGSRRLQVDGLTIWPHADRPRTWARFGDTIRRDGQRWTVTTPEGGPR